MFRYNVNKVTNFSHVDSDESSGQEQGDNIDIGQQLEEPGSEDISDIEDGDGAIDDGESASLSSTD